MSKLCPKKCNLCGGYVIFINNSRVYGRKQNSGKMYICTKCGASVGTHKSNRRIALGILANEEMRDLRVKCHSILDKRLRFFPKIDRNKERKRMYYELAEKLEIDVKDCHFAHFDLETLKRAYEIMKEELSKEKKNRKNKKEEQENGL